MAKNYGTPIGYVMLKAKHTQWKAEVDVLYKDDSVLVLRDWPNTPLPRYYAVTRKFDMVSFNVALNFMDTLNTGGIKLSLFGDEIDGNFENINASFLSLDEAKKQNDALKRQRDADMIEYKKRLSDH